MISKYVNRSPIKIKLTTVHQIGCVKYATVVIEIGHNKREIKKNKCAMVPNSPRIINKNYNLLGKSNGLLIFSRKRSRMYDPIIMISARIKATFRMFYSVYNSIIFAPIDNPESNATAKNIAMKARLALL